MVTLSPSDTQWPLVGRDVELREFEQAWKRQRVRSVVIAGAAGVGKSRLAEACFARARQSGLRGVRVRATDAAAAVPLGALAHLIPVGADMSDPVEGFAAVARAMAGPAGKDHWVVLVDDLPLLDSASRVLLQQVLDAGVARVICTARTGAGGPGSDRLTDVDATHRIDLFPFDDAQVGVLLRLVLGGPVSRRTIVFLSAASGGNVLYLRELVHGALATRSLVGNGEIWGLVEGSMPSTPALSELIGARVASAPGRAWEVLELLAVCEFLPLADALDIVELELLAELEATGLIHVRQDDRRTAVTLSHPLYGEALRARVGTLRRRVLLKAQAERFNAHGMRRHDDVLHVATWLLGATGTADPDLLIQAAVLARHAHDYHHAAKLLRAIPDGHRSHAVLLAHGEALMQLGDWQQADMMLQQAQLATVDETQLVAATLMRTTTLFWMVGRDAALRVNEDALAGLHGADGRYTLTVNEAALRTISGEPGPGLSVLRGIGSDTDKAMDTNVWALAAMSKAMGLAMTGHSHDAITLADAVYARHLQLDRPAMRRQAMGPPPSAQLNSLVVALSEAGRLAEARQTSEKVLTDTARTQELHSWIWAAYFRGRTEWLAGDAAAARHWYAEAIAQGELHNDVQVLHLAWGGLAAAAALLGDVVTAESALKSAADIPRMGSMTGEERIGEAWLHAARGELAQARSVLTEAAAMAAATGHVTSEMLLLTDVARLGDAAATMPRMTELVDVCDGTFATARLQLVAALAADDPNELLASVTPLEQVGAHLLAAEAAIAAAAGWRRAGDPRTAARAAQRAQIYLTRCPAVRTPGLSVGRTEPLTAREREVALLASRGNTSKEIAAALVLSVRTVDNHLQSVYRKLGVENRGELLGVLIPR